MPISPTNSCRSILSYDFQSFLHYWCNSQLGSEFFKVLSSSSIDVIAGVQYCLINLYFWEDLDHDFTVGRPKMVFVALKKPRVSWRSASCWISVAFYFHYEFFRFQMVFWTSAFACWYVRIRLRVPFHGLQDGSNDGVIKSQVPISSWAHSTMSEKDCVVSNEQQKGYHDNKGHGKLI